MWPTALEPGLSASPAVHPGGCVHLVVLRDQKMYFESLQFSITLCFLKQGQKKVQHSFVGHQPCVHPHCLARHTSELHRCNHSVVYTASESGILPILGGLLDTPGEAGDTRWVRSLGWEDPLQKEMAIPSSILAWKLP